MPHKKALSGLVSRADCRESDVRTSRRCTRLKLPISVTASLIDSGLEAFLHASSCPLVLPVAPAMFIDGKDDRDRSTIRWCESQFLLDRVQLGHDRVIVPAPFRFDPKPLSPDGCIDANRRVEVAA